MNQFTGRPEDYPDRIRHWDEDAKRNRRAFRKMKAARQRSRQRRLQAGIARQRALSEGDA